MKVKVHTGTIHKVAETLHSMYFDNIVRTECNQELFQKAWAIHPQEAEQTHKAVTCKTCLKKIEKK